MVLWREMIGKVVIYFLATEPFATAPIKDLSKFCIVGLMIFTGFSVELCITQTKRAKCIGTSERT